MKIAIGFRGGVSRLESSYSSDVIEPESNYIDLKVCANSFYKNIIEENKEHEIDVFLQSWNIDLKNKLENLYKPIESQFESNKKYKTSIKRLAKRSLINQQSLYGTNMEISHYKSHIGGISQAIALHNVWKLIREHEMRRGKYDAIFFYRPDLIITKPLDFSKYSNHAVTCNNFMDRLGDFHFWVPRQYVEEFALVSNSINCGNFHEVHHWIHRFVSDFMGVEMLQDNIIAGTDQEVLRKIRDSKISRETAELYGFNRSHWSKYPRNLQ